MIFITQYIEYGNTGILVPTVEGISFVDAAVTLGTVSTSEIILRILYILFSYLNSRITLRWPLMLVTSLPSNRLLTIYIFIYLHFHYIYSSFMFLFATHKNSLVFFQIPTVCKHSFIFEYLSTIEIWKSVDVAAL